MVAPSGERPLTAGSAENVVAPPGETASQHSSDVADRLAASASAEKTIVEEAKCGVAASPSEALASADAEKTIGETASQHSSDVAGRLDAKGEAELGLSVLCDGMNREDGTTGLHEPSADTVNDGILGSIAARSETPSAYDCRGLDDALKAAIRATAKNEKEAKFLEAVLKQVDIHAVQNQFKAGLTPRSPPAFLLEAEDMEMLLAEGDIWEDVEFEVALDSGSIVNVCHMDDAPGYVLHESMGSKRGRNFVVGD